MSVASPTLVPRSAVFPDLLPKPPQPHPVPLPRYGQQPARFNATRDLAREMEDLSDEEDDLDDLVRMLLLLHEVVTDPTPRPDRRDQEARFQLAHTDWSVLHAARGEE